MEEKQPALRARDGELINELVARGAKHDVVIVLHKKHRSGLLWFRASDENGQLTQRYTSTLRSPSWGRIDLHTYLDGVEAGKRG